VETDSFVGVIGEGSVGVTEVAVVDFLPPFGEDVIEVMRDAGDRGGLREVALVEAQREARDIGHLIECAWDVSLATVVQPGFAPGLQLDRGIYSARPRTLSINISGVIGCGR
jgi:hypothetical protein